MAGKSPRSRVGVFSSQKAVRQVDGRTREAKIIASTIRDLTQQLGGDDRVSAAQKLLIHSTAILVLRLRCALDKYAAGENCESLDRHVVSIQNALRLNLSTLGMENVAAEAPSLARFLEARRVA